MGKGIPATLAILDTDGLSAVRELKQLRIEATRRNDADLLAPLLDAQFIYVNSAGEVFDKNHYLQSIRTQSLSYDRDFDVMETEVQVLDDVIILVGIMLGRSGVDREQAFHFPCIGVWRKDSGHWRMLAFSHRRATSWRRTCSADPGAGTSRSCFASNGGQGRALLRAGICFGG